MRRDLRGYAICTTGRTGSNWLCALLTSTGVLGRPREYFNAAARREFDDPDYPLEPAAQFRRILEAGATANGIYGLKIFPHQHDTIAATYAWTELLPDLRFVWLQRRDLLGQAISLARASQSGQFRSTVAPRTPPRYDAGLIQECLATVVRHQARWALFFARTGIAPLPVLYEDIVADPQHVVGRVGALVGLGDAARIRPELVDFRKQRDAETEDWRARFIRENGDRNAIDAL
jgi:LPS sulfotransferase NodH